MPNKEIKRILCITSSMNAGRSRNVSYENLQKYR